MAFYEWQYVNGEIDTDAKPPAPKWLLDRLGVDCFYNLAYVWFEGELTDEFLARVGHLKHLKELDLRGSTLTEGQWRIIKALPSLRTLGFCRMQLTDTASSHLEGLTQLQRLRLWDNDITDAGLAHLKGLTQPSAMPGTTTSRTQARTPGGR